jgi:hypothetical protein
MSDETRNILTVICVLVIGFGVWRLYRAERAADSAYTKMGGVKRNIRRRISRGKRMLGWSGVFLVLSIQPLTDYLPVIGDWPLRAFFFMVAVVLYTLGMSEIDEGYQDMDSDMDFFLEGDMLSTQQYQDKEPQ